MNLNEFKSWLDGFSASINGAPTIDQWKIILTKINDISPPIPCVLPIYRMGTMNPPFLITCNGTTNSGNYSEVNK